MVNSHVLSGEKKRGEYIFDANLPVYVCVTQALFERGIGVGEVACSDFIGAIQLTPE